MKNITILIIAFCCFGSSTLFGQIPGFKGKKHFIEYDLYYMIAIGGPTAKGKMYAYNDFAFSTRHNLKYNYVVSRYETIGVGIDALKTGIEVTWKEGDQIMTEFNQIRARAFGLHYNRYFMKRGSIAPIGLYHHFEGKLITTKGISGVLAHTTVRSLYTGYGLGFRKIFKNKFFLNFSAQAGWTWGERDPSIDEEQTLRNQVNQRIYSHYIFENNIGLGILLF